MSGLNVPDYHIHFITADHKQGGHVLDWNVGTVKVQIAEIADFRMILPRNRGFYAVPLSGGGKDNLMQVEHNMSGK